MKLGCEVDIVISMRLVLIAVLLALAYCAAPGPVLAEAARRGLKSGFRAALAVELGSLAGDALWIGLMFAGAAALAGAGGIRLAAGAVGGLFLLGLGPARVVERSAQAASRKRQRGGRASLRDRGGDQRRQPLCDPLLDRGLGISFQLRDLIPPAPSATAAFSATFMLTCLAFALFSGRRDLLGGARFLREPRFFAAADLVGGALFVVLGLNLLFFTTTHLIG